MPLLLPYSPVLKWDPSTELYAVVFLINRWKGRIMTWALECSVVHASSIYFVSPFHVSSNYDLFSVQKSSIKCIRIGYFCSIPSKSQTELHLVVVNVPYSQGLSSFAFERIGIKFSKAMEWGHSYLLEFQKQKASFRMLSLQLTTYSA